MHSVPIPAPAVLGDQRAPAPAQCIHAEVGDMEAAVVVEVEVAAAVSADAVEDAEATRACWTIPVLDASRP